MNHFEQTLLILLTFLDVLQKCQCSSNVHQSPEQLQQPQQCFDGIAQPEI